MPCASPQGTKQAGHGASAGSAHLIDQAGYHLLHAVSGNLPTRTVVRLPAAHLAALSTRRGRPEEPQHTVSMASCPVCTTRPRPWLVAEIMAEELSPRTPASTMGWPPHKIWVEA